MSREKGKVVRLSSYRHTGHYHLLNEVESYWEALRDGSLAPDRASVDPRGLERALDNIFFLEKLGYGAIRIRLAGRIVETMVGMDPRSLPFAALFDGDDREQLRNLIEGMLQKPEVLTLRVREGAVHGPGRLNGAIILLPLRDEQGTICQALGCIQFDRSEHSQSAGLRIMSSARRRITNTSPRPEKMPPLIEEGFHAFAEDPQQFQHKRPDESKPPKLRLVKR